MCCGPFFLVFRPCKSTFLLHYFHEILFKYQTSHLSSKKGFAISRKKFRESLTLIWHFRHLSNQNKKCLRVIFHIKIGPKSMQAGTNSVIYGLEFQCRALASLESENDEVKFVVGTQGPRASNQVCNFSVSSSLQFASNLSF